MGEEWGGGYCQQTEYIIKFVSRKVIKIGEQTKRNLQATNEILKILLTCALKNTRLNQDLRITHQSNYLNSTKIDQDS